MTDTGIFNAPNAAWAISSLATLQMIRSSSVRYALNDFFGVVDEIVKENGGTATLFVKAGDEHVRVATNVKKDDGSRRCRDGAGPQWPGDCDDQEGRSVLRRGEHFGQALHHVL